MLLTACDTDANTLLADLYKDKYEKLEEKLHAYYREELALRGDKILNREYLSYFGIEK